ncbi:MAG: epoxyqueuosine reductase QueH [Desulfobulbaceae bacterium]
MNILLHVCCAPCTVFPLRVLRDQGHEVTGYFYNPNIHPFTEFARRLATLREYAAVETLPLSVEEDYGLRDYLRQVVFHEDERCAICYTMRLGQTARFAATSGAEAFTTTLLYSRYQNHGLIRETGEALALRYGVSFYYEDFRRGWQEGIDQSVALGLYRQPYCGCIYSEQERYDRNLRKKRSSMSKTRLD